MTAVERGVNLFSGSNTVVLVRNLNNSISDLNSLTALQTQPMDFDIHDDTKRN